MAAVLRSAAGSFVNSGRETAKEVCLSRHCYGRPEKLTLNGNVRLFAVHRVSERDWRRMHSTDISYTSLSCYDSKNSWSVDSRPILSSIPPVRRQFLLGRYFIRDKLSEDAETSPNFVFYRALRPGWLVRYFVGPYDVVWVENLIADVCAGVTVALTLIPQGDDTASTFRNPLGCQDWLLTRAFFFVLPALSYAALANLAPVQGLYAAILPSAVYTFLGSSMQVQFYTMCRIKWEIIDIWSSKYHLFMQLAVGPVAIVSLLTGTIWI